MIGAISGHLCPEDEKFEEKKILASLMLPAVLGVLESASTNANSAIVGAEIFVRLFVSSNGQKRKYSRHANMNILINSVKKQNQGRETQNRR